MNAEIKKDIVQAIKDLEDRKGRITAEDVVSAAKKESSPLHACFEWDDTKAAEAYRVQQARELIRFVKIHVEHGERTLRVVAYVRDPDRESGEQGYINTLRVSSPTSEAVMAGELNRIVGLLDRAAGIALARQDELPAGTHTAITAIMKKTAQLLSTMKT